MNGTSVKSTGVGGPQVSDALSLPWIYRASTVHQDTDPRWYVGPVLDGEVIVVATVYKEADAEYLVHLHNARLEEA